MAELLRADPVQSTARFARRLARFTGVKLASGHLATRALPWALARLGVDFDAFANSAARGFAPANLLDQLRHQPSTAMLRLMRRRWTSYDFSRIERPS
jgi:hypothetical protein